MDLEQLCLVLVPRPSDDWEDPVPQEKGSPEIDINTTYIVKFIETTIMVQTCSFLECHTVKDVPVYAYHTKCLNATTWE